MKTLSLFLLLLLMSCIESPNVTEPNVCDTTIYDTIRVYDTIIVYKPPIKPKLTIETENGNVKYYGDFKAVVFQDVKDSILTIVDDNDSSYFYANDTLRML